MQGGIKYVERFYERQKHANFFRGNLGASKAIKYANINNFRKKGF